MKHEKDWRLEAQAFVGFVALLSTDFMASQKEVAMHHVRSNRSGNRTQAQLPRLLSRRQLFDMAETVAAHTEASLALAGIDERFEAFIEMEFSRSGSTDEAAGDDDLVIAFRLDEELEEEDDSSLPVFLTCGVDGAIHIMIMDGAGEILEGPARGIDEMETIIADFCAALIELQGEFRPVLH